MDKLRKDKNENEEEEKKKKIKKRKKKKKKKGQYENKESKNEKKFENKESKNERKFEIKKEIKFEKNEENEDSDSLWMGESEFSSSVNYPSEEVFPKKNLQKISTPFDNFYEEDNKNSKNENQDKLNKEKKGSSIENKIKLNQSNPFLDEEIKQHWTISSIEKPENSIMMNHHNFYPSLTENFGDNFFQKMENESKFLEKESKNIADSFNDNFFEETIVQEKHMEFPQNTDDFSRGRGNAVKWSKNHDFGLINPEQNWNGNQRQKGNSILFNFLNSIL